MLFSIKSMNPRMSSKPVTTTPTTQPMPTPQKKIVNPPVIQTQQPAVVQKQSYKDLVFYIKNATNVWDNSSERLKTDFVTTIVTKARAANLEDFELDSLLQTARDIHAQFSDNQNKNITILKSLENQRVTAIK